MQISSHFPFRFALPTIIEFGSNSFDALGTRASALGNAPLVVTGKHSAHAMGLLERVLQQLPNARVFDAIGENPDTTICEQGAAFSREHNCDVIVAIGGGSPMDAAKAIAVLARNDGPCAHYFGADKYVNAPLPIIAVPTTAGTGSEVTPYSVLVDPVERTKRTIAGNALFPRVALLDPELTRSMPRNVTIATGLDALSQCMEGIVSKKSTPLGDALALDGIRRVCEFLPRAADDGENDIDARTQMLCAALASGIIVAQSGTTLVHGMGYAYTIECGIAHGLANALLLAPVFAHNARIAPARLASIASAMGGDPANPGTAVVQSLYNLLDRLEVSRCAHDHGVTEEQIEKFATEIAKDPYRFRNQIGDLTRDDVYRFYRQSLDGAL
ncbi:MAG: iron-containing alcohol dehydrogenase [Candidatus Hydrogenedentes bacterium]|nr:iron-containing alcohol dehydrogenase [Candidatus Hydrogenedentota bacterium]